MVVKVYLDEKLEAKFRKAAMEVYGYGRGSLSSAAEEAIRSWVSDYEAQHMGLTEEDPVDSIRGLLDHVNKGSVEPQHKAGEIRAEN
jgi:hypothetical protein